MSEYVIENLTDLEIKNLINSNTDIEWFPDDMFDDSNSNICIYGTKKDVKIILQIIGRR